MLHHEDCYRRACSAFTILSTDESAAFYIKGVAKMLFFSFQCPSRLYVADYLLTNELDKEQQNNNNLVLSFTFLNDIAPSPSSLPAIPVQCLSPFP